MKRIQKRGAVYGVIALLLCAAIYLNWSYVDAPEELLATDAATEDGAAQQSATSEQQDYFASSRLTREQARDEAVGILRQTAESTEADQTARDEASAQISVLAEQSVSEANIESLIRAKGYADAVAMIGEDSVNVVVAPPEEGLQAADVTVIRDIVMSETGLAADSITIVEASDAGI